MDFSNNSNRRTIATINVTPFVDVVLVLLVIFMITAPLMFSGIVLKLPKTKKVHQIRMTTEQVIVSISSAGELFLGKDKILYSELVPLVIERFKSTDNKIIYLRAHNDINYGQVAKVMSILKRSGITDIALVTETIQDE